MENVVQKLGMAGFVPGKEPVSVSVTGTWEGKEDAGAVE